MLEISADVIMHKLNIDSKYKPVKQKKRSSTPKRQKAIDEKVDKLLKAGFIKKAWYPNWIANVVMVRKANEKWRIYIDFTDLNKAYPKDSFLFQKLTN